MYRKKKAPSEQTNAPSVLGQTDPPSIPVVDLFPSGEFPEGEIQNYKDEWVCAYLFIKFFFSISVLLCVCVYIYILIYPHIWLWGFEFNTIVIGEKV